MKIMRISLVIAAWLVIPAGLSAQVYLPTGFPRFGTFAPSSFDAVNAANLNVNFSIPVLKKAGRGIPFNYIFTYNSSVWSPQSSSGANQWTPTPGFGWNMEGDPLGDSFSRQSVFFGSASYQETKQNCTPPPPYGQETYDVYGPWFYTDPAGTALRFVVYVDDQPEMAPHCIGDPYPSPASGGAEDGSGWKIVASINTSNAPTAQFTSPSGWQYQPALGANPYLKDTNGNQVTETTQNGNFVLVDTLGQDALTFTSLSQYSYPNAAGSTSTVTVVVTPSTVATSFGCSGVGEFGPVMNQPLVTEIDLPDDNPNGTRDRYLISYESNPNFPGDYTGRIASVTLPTGGTISYKYTGGSNGINCADGSTNTLTRTTPDGVWSYVHTVGTGTHYWTWTTNITDPSPFSDQTTMNFQGMYETERKVNQGSSTLLETVDTCYNGASIPCTGTYPAYPISNRTVQTTVPGVSPSKTYTTYNSTNNLPTEVDEYDWGPTLARKTLTTYDYNTSCGISSGSSITDHPCNVTIENSSGGTVASTTNAYDTYGNLTSVTSGGLTKSFTYDYSNGGRLITSKDAGGNTTNYYYGSNSCGAFPDTVTPPISALQTTAVWNCNGAVMTSSTDPNGQTTSFTYDDPMNRLTEISYPDGGWQGIYYPNPTAVNFAKGLTSSNVRTDQILLDSSGRTIYKKLTSDPAGIDYVTTSYDALGRVLQVSNPYRTSSTGSDTYAYDALNRVTSVTHADGGSVSYTYSGNCVTTADEAQKSRQSCSDALGRVTKVIEDPGSSGHLDYETDYTYDALNDLTGVTQGSQTRTYSYDQLGRLLSETNPESGTTSYTYDSDSTCGTYRGDLVKRKDNRGISTCYSYDALHRLTQKSYSDGTPTANFYYDETSVTIGSFTTPSGSPALPKGRLTHTTTTSGSTVLAATINSYDPMGRVLNFWQCSPYNCGSSSIWSMSYSYDLAGDVTSWTHPEGFTISNQINEAQQITQITSSLNDSNHPGTLATLTYMPWGAIYTLTNGCAGSGCTQVQETYDYNNRLQPIRTQLGTASNSSADYCWVYNYYSATPPSACSTTQASGSDNGNAQSSWYNDNVNTSLDHTAAYSYDSLNRLYQATAKNFSGTSLWFQQYDNDRWGNMSCDPSSSGLCTQLTFNSSNNNQISQIGSKTAGYDAAGNLTSDGTYTYQYDAEGRLSEVLQGSTTISTATYNALGLLARRMTTSFTVDLPHDPAGQTMGFFNGSNGTWWEQQFWGAGRMLGQYDFGVTYFIHRNNIGSSTQLTNASGASSGDMLFYPFGENWQFLNDPSGGWWKFYGSFSRFQQDLGLFLTPNRLQSPALARWMTPDPAGKKVVNLADPQTWNMYAYVGNNPTSRVDPSGLAAMGDFSQNGYGDDSSGGCIVDGITTPCGMAIAMVHSGAAVVCPGNCEEFNENGQAVYYKASAVGAGYFAYSGPGALYYSVGAAGEAGALADQQASANDSTMREYGQPVYSEAGFYSYAKPQVGPPCNLNTGACGPWGVDVTAIPRGTTAIGLAHDHPGTGFGAYNFSDYGKGNDIDTYLQYGFYGFVATQPSGRVLMFDPNQFANYMTTPGAPPPVCVLSGPPMGGVACR